MWRYALPVVLAVLLVVAGATAGVGAGTASGGTESSRDVAIGTDVSAVQSGDFDVTPSTTFHVRLRPNTDAAWTVSVRYQLTTENETAAFETVAQDFEEGVAGPSADLYRNLAAGAAESTGREMEIRGVEREATLDESPEVEDEAVVAVGTLELRFVWTNFLAQEGEDLRLGDVFRTENGGTWLRTLEATQRLIIETPDQYQVSSTPGVSVSLEENAVVIEGPRTFGPDQHVQVVYSPTAVSSQPPWLLLAGAVVLAGLIVVVGLFTYRRVTGPSPNGDAGGPNGAGVGVEPGNGAGATEDGAAAAGTATGAAEGTAGAGAGAHNGAGAGAEGGAGAPAGGEGDSVEGTGTGQASGGPEEEDLSLLSDAERVERLLERNGGRMRQADIVEETDWSDAKVSQLLSSMADEGRVEKLRLGRENLISLPEYGDDEDSL